MTDGTGHRLSLRQADAARADLYAIHDELDFIKTQIALARLPTRRDLARIALLSMARDASGFTVRRRSTRPATGAKCSAASLAA
jgi:hypothetical protein